MAVNVLRLGSGPHGPNALRP